MKNYSDRLIKQFQLATGIMNVDVNSKEFILEYFMWLDKLQAIASKYIYFLDYLNLNYDTSTCAEVGKSNDDSVVKPFDTKIITSLPKSFKNIDKDRLIEGEMQIIFDEPIIVQGNGKDIKRTHFSKKDISTYMTQNPIFDKDIYRWENLHNSGNSKIIVGVYGNQYDKDKNIKIKRVKNLINYLDDTCFDSDYTIIDDTYMYVVGTKWKTSGENDRVRCRIR